MKPTIDYDLMKPVFPQLKKWRDDLERHMKLQQQLSEVAARLFPEDQDAS